MKTIRWGIIGCGNVTEVKSGPGFQKARNSELVAVMRRNGGLAKDYAQRHGIARWYDDAAKLINDSEVDAVYIATPPSSHREYTLLAARAGKPIYVEKPMACNYQECLDMIEACTNAGVPLFVAYYRRALDRFNKIKEIIDSGAIGPVRFVNIMLYQKPSEDEYNRETLPWRVIPKIAGGGKFLDLASHTLDIMDYILGPITEAKGYASNQAGLYEAEDMVTASMKFESGVQGAGMWSFSSYKSHDMNEIVGSSGKVTFSTFGNEPILVENEKGIAEYRIVNPLHIQQQLIQTIVDELNGAGRCPSTGITGARTSRVMDAVIGDYYKEK